jgi:hypothetical protein
MRFLIGTAAGGIIVYGVDQFFYAGQIVPALPRIGKAILAGFGFYF